MTCKERCCGTRGLRMLPGLGEAHTSLMLHTEHGHQALCDDKCFLDLSRAPQKSAVTGATIPSFARMVPASQRPRQCLGCRSHKLVNPFRALMPYFAVRI